MSKCSRLDLFQSDQCVNVDVLGESICLRFAFKYNHLGTVMDTGADVSSEVGIRSVVIKKETQRMRRRIFGQSFNPHREEKQLCTDLCMVQGFISVRCSE